MAGSTRYRSDRSASNVVSDIAAANTGGALTLGQLLGIKPILARDANGVRRIDSM